MRPLGPALLEAMRATSIEAARSKDHYDAVVVGSGATGGLAAMLLTEAGLRVLVLNAGASRPSLKWAARGFVHRAGATLLRGAAPRVLNHILSTSIGRRAMASRQPIQSQCYAWAGAPEQFVDDVDCPYTVTPEEPFTWLRSRQLGGRMVIPNHGKQYYRLSPGDLAPDDELSPVWPLKYAELEPWYEDVERRLCLSGTAESAPWFSSSKISRPLECTPVEEELRSRIKSRWPNSNPILGASAPPMDSLETAAATQRLSVRSGAVVREIEIDESGHVRAVVWIDEQHKTETHTSARLVFLCASALESTRILLLSRSSSRPSGLGGGSGALGCYLMDHVRVKGEGLVPELESDSAADIGRCIYLPRFDARDFSEPQTGRGFGIQLYSGPGRKGGTHFSMGCFGEMLPRAENRVTIDWNRTDAWGIPILDISCRHGSFELALANEQIFALKQLAEGIGATICQVDTVPAPPGSANHECGTARMGDSPANSVLGPFNECWDARGLFVTDGSCLPSQGFQNPTLTLLALTARACAHALHGDV